MFLVNNDADQFNIFRLYFTNNMLKVYDTMSEINAVPYVRHVAILHNKLVDAIGTVNSLFTYQVNS